MLQDKFAEVPDRRRSPEEEKKPLPSCPDRQISGAVYALDEPVGAISKPSVPRQTLYQGLAVRRFDEVIEPTK